MTLHIMHYISSTIDDINNTITGVDFMQTLLLEIFKAIIPAHINFIK